MSKRTLLLKNDTPCDTVECLRQKEQQAYIALSALIDLLKDSPKPTHAYKPPMDFAEYKQAVLAQATKLKLCPDITINCNENQFNLMHYQHAILSASKENYRNMAILAAKHTLTKSSLERLVKQIKKRCLRLSKEIEIASHKQLLEDARASHTTLSNAVIITEVA